MVGSAKERIFFFEKKKQKTFVLESGGTPPTQAQPQICKSLFASFSSEKEDSFLILCLSLALLVATTITAQGEPVSAKKPATLDGKPYSNPVRTDLPQRVLWGDMHLHTENSFDAGLYGTRLGPEDAFRFARGEAVVSTTGVPAKLSRPYDFLVVTDHSDYMGVPLGLRNGTPELLANAVGRKWYDEYHAKDDTRFTVVSTILKDIKNGTPTLHDPELARSVWQKAVAAAEKYNEPGRFSAIIGFEWSSAPDGNNLHRNVIFRDDADKALQVVPLTTFENRDPESLWQYLASYEQKTGGQILCIPHNSDLSGGMMFADRTFGGKPLDRAYAEARARWEPVAEITQNKGDSETLPLLSPDDEFANFERWDKANIGGTRLDKPEEQPFNYLRPSLTRGLKYAQTIGVNPFKYGLIGSTDSHTGLSTAAADNYFGARPEGEPSRTRKNLAPTKTATKALGEMGVADRASSGLAAIWATQNTRAAIFDALRRKEVYATTGPRITVRVFAGWHFTSQDATRSDFAANGYAHGVPMGGDLSGAKPGQTPTLLIQAAKDPDGANLDRVQVVKGWIDSSNTTHETIYDVAWSGSRAPGADGKLPPVGNTVDIKTATYGNSIGAAVLATAWRDRDFKADERSYYYIRVIEIPTPRWTTYDAARFGSALPGSQPATVAQRAYTSPIWYTPNQGE
jgi:hypothetical protein